VVCAADANDRLAATPTATESASVRNRRREYVEVFIISLRFTLNLLFTFYFAL
jgi:hypothetical protein